MPSAEAKAIPEVQPVPGAEIDYSPMNEDFDPLGLRTVSEEDRILGMTLTDRWLSGELSDEEFAALPDGVQAGVIVELEQRAVHEIPMQASEMRVRSDSVENQWLINMERAACLASLGPVVCVTMNRAASDAKEATFALFQRDAGRDESDAFRHCYWNALMTIRVDSNSAKIIADNHERYSVQVGEPTFQEESEMDLYNNAQGRMIGNTAKALGAHGEFYARTRCYAWATTGVLKTLPPL